MTRARVAWSVALLLSMPELVSAQGIVTLDGGTLRCAPTSAEQVCTVPGVCLSAEHTCHAIGSSSGVCAPPDALFCGTAGSAACPIGTSPISWNGMFVCVEPDAHLCGDASSSACFTSRSSPGGPSRFPVAWRFGDCDGDGVPNGLEVGEGLCVPRPTLGVTTGDDCITPPGCTGAGACLAGSVCTLVEGARHRYCLPEDDFVFCCGGILGVDCPAGNLCQSQPMTPDDFGFCEHFEYCTSFFFADRLSCLDGSGGFPVEPGDGDCDGDGLENAEDPDPCVPEAVVSPDGGAQPDAGPARDAGEVAEEDGGEVGRDAGEPSPMDAGPAELQPLFSGGGGCVCRATSPRGGSGGLSGLVLAAILILRRRFTS